VSGPQPSRVPIELIIGLVVVVGILAAFLVSAFNHGREAARQATCQKNLEQFGEFYERFAMESMGERFPQLSNEAGRLMFSPHESSRSGPVYPSYLSDLEVFVCPGDDDAELVHEPGASEDPELLIDDHSYFYLGYMVVNEEELAAFAVAYKAHLAEGKAFLDDLPVPEGTGTLGGDAFEHLHLWTSAWHYYPEAVRIGKLLASMPVIPIMVERPENHIPQGGNVLFMDGHVEFLRYPGKWPMTEKSIGILESLDAL
jgi:prepilin-type processing-associated H-X9-DG protein